MGINLSVPQTREMKPRITVFGVGGAGGNAVTNMIHAGLDDVDFVVANTDAQALGMAAAERKIQLGTSLTEGLGAGSRPDVGCAAAEEAMPEILEHLTGAHMVFITAGMGGGTGTGAAPVIARAARDQGILTVGVVTKPFQFEGARRLRTAEEGIAELQRHVDTLIIIPNQNLFRVANEHTTFADAFAMADQVLHMGVAGITDLMMKPGLINLDFADVRTVMNEMGKAMMGTGEASGEKRAIEAAEAAISNPLLDEVSMKGARGVLVNITGGMDLTLYEVDEATNRIRSEVDPEANIIVGSTFDSSLDGMMRVSVVATGIDAEDAQEAEPRTEQRTNATNSGAQQPAAKSGGEVAEEQGAPAAASASPKSDTMAADPVTVEQAPQTLDTPKTVYHPQRTPAEDPAAAQAQAAPEASETRSFPGGRLVPVNAGRAPKQGPGLFERWLGGGRRDREAAPAQTDPTPQAKAPQSPPREDERPVDRYDTAAASGQADPADSDATARQEAAARTASDAPRREPARGSESPEQPPRRAGKQGTAQGTLIEPRFDDEQLEIPAFLRRQAN